MKWKPNFLSQAGFTLVEVLIAAAALGGLALVATQLTSDVDKTKKHFEVTTEITSIKTTIASTMYSSIACNNTFGGQDITGNITIPSIRNSANTPLYSAGTSYYNNKIRINSFTVVSRTLTNSGTGKVGTFTLRIAFEKLSTASVDSVIGAAKGGKLVNEDITVRVTTDAADVVQECYNDLLSAEETVCTLIGGTFTSAPTEYCTFKAYPGITTINTLDTSVPSERIAISERYLAQFLDDLDRRYVNANTGGGGAQETLADTTNTLTIGDNAASGGDTVFLNARVSVGTTNAPSTFLRVGGVTGAIPSGWGGGVHAFDVYSTSGTIGVGNGNGTTTFGTGIISFMSSAGIFTNGTMGVGTDNALGYRLNVNGNGIGTAWETNSDKRLKKNIEDVKDPVEKLLGLRGVTFDWRNDEFPERNLPNRKTYGFIAQEMEKVIPELVSTDTNGFKAIQYQNLTSVLVEAFKEAWAKIKDVANKLADLDDKADKLAKENQKLEKRVKELEANHKALVEESRAIKELICADVDKKSKKYKICK